MISFTVLFIILYAAIVATFLIFPKKALLYVIRRDMDENFTNNKSNYLLLFKLLIFAAALATIIIMFFIKMIFY